jgi:uncharacterized damage-inducible protein DinB
MSNPSNYLAYARTQFQANRDTIRSVLESLAETDLHDARGASNSIAVLVQHLHGAHFRRWTDLFSANPAGVSPDFKKEWDDRELSRADLIRLHEEGWERVFRTLEGLSENDLQRSVPLRGTEIPLLQAIISHLSHYNYHVGQIILLAKIATQGRWSAASAKAKAAETSRQPAAVP